MKKLVGLNLLDKSNLILDYDFSFSKIENTFKEKNAKISSVIYKLNPLSYVGININPKTLKIEKVPTIDAVDIFDDNSIIAYYKLDGNAKDETGNYDGTWEGNENYDDNGKFGKCAYFDGDSYIKTDINLKDLLHSKNCGFSLWVKANPDDNEDVVEFFGYRRDSYNDEFSILWNNKDDKLVAIHGGGSYSKTIEKSSINNIIKDWTHIAIYFKDEYFYMFINNEFIGRQSINTHNEHNDRKIYIGYAYSNKKLKGYIDNIRIFNRALTENEIQILFEEKKFKVLNLEKEKNNLLMHYIAERPKYDNQEMLKTFYIKKFLIKNFNKNITLSFDFLSNITGTFSVSFVKKTKEKIQSFIKDFEYKNEFEIKKIILEKFEIEKFFASDTKNVEYELIICGYSEPPDDDEDDKPNYVGSVGLNDGYKVCSDNASFIPKKSLFAIKNLCLVESDIYLGEIKNQKTIENLILNINKKNEIKKEIFFVKQGDEVDGGQYDYRTYYFDDIENIQDYNISFEKEYSSNVSSYEFIKSLNDRKTKNSVILKVKPSRSGNLTILQGTLILTKK